MLWIGFISSKRNFFVCSGVEHSGWGRASMGSIDSPLLARTMLDEESLADGFYQ
jgi:hypothetical protein